MSNPSVVLIVDHPQRDLAGLVLTAHALCQCGVDCHLVSHNVEAREVWALAPDLVIMNFFRPGNDTFARQMMKAGILFGLLDTEGGVWASLDNYSELLWQDKSLLHAAVGVCTWGPALAEYLVAEDLFTAGQVVVTGCPRFDLYHRDWRPLLEFAGSRRDTPFHILVNTNYSAANPRFATVEQNIDQFRHQFSFDEERIHAVVGMEESAINLVTAMVRDLAADFPSSRITLRPHPFEKPERYAGTLADVPNVTVSNDGPVQAQIFQADVVVQRSCTTAIEAFMAGVPTFSPQWIPAPSVNPMSEAVSIPCAGYPALVSQIEAVRDGAFSLPDGFRASAEQEVHRWFYLSDGAAHRRVSSAVMQWLERRTPVDRALCAKYLYGLDSRRQDLGVRVSQRVRYHLRLPPDWSFREMRSVPFRPRKDKSFTVGEVQSLADEIGKLAQGHALRVEACSSRESGAYSHGFVGSAVSLKRGRTA